MREALLGITQHDVSTSGVVHEILRSTKFHYVLVKVCGTKNIRLSLVVYVQCGLSQPFAIVSVWRVRSCKLQSVSFVEFPTKFGDS